MAFCPPTRARFIELKKVDLKMGLVHPETHQLAEFTVQEILS